MADGPGAGQAFDQIGAGEGVADAALVAFGRTVVVAQCGGARPFVSSAWSGISTATTRRFRVRGEATRAM